MKTTVILLSLSVLAACAPAGGRPTDSAGRPEISPAEVCMSGVVYYRSRGNYHTSYTPKFLPDSTVATCD